MKLPQKEMTAVSVGAEPRSGVPETNFNVISLPDAHAKSKDYFYTVDAETLLTTTLPPIRFVVGELLPQGLHILAGSSKIGKSWMVLWWCLQIARGEPVWTFPTEKGTVLYLCLEDSFTRIQDRLFDFTSEAPSNLHFATMANTLGEGLETQIENFIREHDDTKLIVIDTLQYIRPVSRDANAYANDYRDMRQLKNIADEHRIAVLLVHHFRKEKDADSVNRISGTNGISGGVDTNFTLSRDHRSGGQAMMECVGRDIAFRQLQIAFDTETHIWNLVSDSVTEKPQPSDNIIFLLCEYLKCVQSFCGTATELADAVQHHSGEKIRPNVLAKKLVRFADELSSYGIRCDRNRTHERKEILLEYDCVGCVCNDGKTGSGSVSDLPTQPSQPTRGIENSDDNAARLGRSLSLERQASHPAIRRTQLARGAAPDPKVPVTSAEVTGTLTRAAHLAGGTSSPACPLQPPAGLGTKGDAYEE